MPRAGSAKGRVPSAVPSEIQASLIEPGKSVAKKSRPPASVRLAGDDPSAPGPMSLTRPVPSGVPSLFHSSRPVSVVEAAK